MFSALADLQGPIAPRLRADLNSIPWLDLTFDLQRSTNIQTRLEAFMSQARYFQRRIELALPGAHS